MPYQTMSKADGRKYLPHIWNLFFKTLSEPDFFVEPWDNRELGDCAEFRLGTGKDGGDEIFFFVTDEELTSFLTNTQEFYLFGAYGQINVGQMRARGIATPEENHPETEQIRARLRSNIASRVEALVNKLDEQEAAQRFTILDKGTMFCFGINSFAHAMYQRG